MIALGAALFPGAYAAGLWAHPRAGGPCRAGCRRRWRSAPGFIATVWGGDYAVRALMVGPAAARPRRACPRAAG